MTVQHYLLKSEPSEFSIQHLQANNREEWDGVRSYAARNHLQSMKEGDQCFFYHSSCKTPSIVGTCRIVRMAEPDATAANPIHKNYDPKSTPENIRWVSVLVEHEETFDTPITMEELRAQASVNPIIGNFILLRQSRLSVMPVSDQEWQEILELQARKQRGDDLMDVSDKEANSKATRKRGRSTETKLQSKPMKESGTSLLVDDPNYTSDPDNVLSSASIYSIRDGHAEMITEKDLGLPGRKHIYQLNDSNLGTVLVFVYEGGKFVGKDWDRMKNMITIAKLRLSDGQGTITKVFLLLSGSSNICRRKTLPQVLESGTIVQRVSSL